MIRYYTYYNYGGYKTLLLGCEEEKEESTYYLPLLPIDEKKLEEKPDEKLKEKVERQKKLASISVMTNQSEGSLSPEASMALSHGGYKLIYQTTADGRRFISLRDIEAEKDDTGRDAPFLMIWEGDSAEDWLKLDTLAEYLRKNLSEIEGRLPKLFEYDPINNGLRFRIGEFNEYMSEIWTSKGDSETEKKASLTETSEGASEAETEGTLTETPERDSEEEPDGTLMEERPLRKVRLLIMTPGTTIEVPVRELKIDRSDISTAEDTDGRNLLDTSDHVKEQEYSASPFQRRPSSHNGDGLTHLLDRIDEKIERIDEKLGLIDEQAFQQEVDRLKELGLNGVNKVKETLPKFKKLFGDFLSDTN